MGVEKAYLVVLIVLFLGIAGCAPQAIETPPAQQVQNDALPMTVRFAHSTDAFYNVQAEYPQFPNADAAFNAEVSSFVEDAITSFKSDAKANYEARVATSNGTLPATPTAPFDFVATWEPVQLNDMYLSFSVSVYYFTGGAHGANEVRTYNYDMQGQHQISIQDFLGSQDAFSTLANLSAQKVASMMESNGATVEGFLQEMIDSGTAPTADNYKEFTFNYNTLTIHFQQYQVAPGYFGPVTITLSKNELESAGIYSEYFS